MNGTNDADTELVIKSHLFDFDAGERESYLFYISCFKLLRV